MKKILIMLLGAFLLVSSIQADEIEVKVPLDIDGLPNNGDIITNTGRSEHITHVYLKFEMFGCNDERIFRKWLPLPSTGIHKTITVKKSFVTECGSSNPQITVLMNFATTSISYGYPARGMSDGDSSIKSLVITNVDAVRGYFQKVN